MPGEEPLFALRDVEQVRGETAILGGLSVDIPHARITALLGPSGSGKTSMLRLLNRLDDPTRGTVFFKGEPITSYPVIELRRRVGFVAQTPAMFAGTVEDNLRVAVELGGPDARARALPYERVLDAVELPVALLGREAARLSGGERQRVNLARALMTRPEVLLLDEPTSALDEEIAERLLNTIALLPDRYGVTVVMITHRLKEARDISDWSILLDHGRLVEAGPTERLFVAAENPRTREFLATTV